MDTVSFSSEGVVSSHTEVINHEDVVDTANQPVLRLRLKKPKIDKKVGWREGTVDNEHMGKKKSKCCCIYKKPTVFGESSSEDDEDCENCFGHPEKRRRNRNHDENDHHQNENNHHEEKDQNIESNDNHHDDNDLHHDDNDHHHDDNDLHHDDSDHHHNDNDNNSEHKNKAKSNE